MTTIISVHAKLATQDGIVASVLQGITEIAQMIKVALVSLYISMHCFYLTQTYNFFSFL